MLDQGLRIAPWHLTIYPNVVETALITLAAGALVGIFNGLLITKLNVAPFIATLGTLYIARGAALLISDGQTFPNLVGRPELGNTGFPYLGDGTMLGIPVSIVALVAIGALAAYVAARTPFGRQVYAVGGNERAALMSGVRIDRIKIVVYAIAAAVLGGTSLAGGRGSVGGTIIGAFVIGVLSDGLVMLGVSSFWQMVIKGSVIIAAVVLDQLQRQMQRRMALQAQLG
jgi:erythritol transport system permease protein